MKWILLSYILMAPDQPGVKIPTKNGLVSRIVSAGSCREYS